MSDRFERCKEHQVRNCLVCHPITRAAKAVPTQANPAAPPQATTALPDLPPFPNASEVEVASPITVPSAITESPIADIPAKSPIGDPTGTIPGWTTIGPPQPKQDRPVYTANSYEAQVTAASTRFTEACKNFMLAQTKVAQMREQLEKAKNEEELAHVERVESQNALKDLIAKEDK